MHEGQVQPAVTEPQVIERISTELDITFMNEAKAVKLHPVDMVGEIRNAAVACSADPDLNPVGPQIRTLAPGQRWRNDSTYNLIEAWLLFHGFQDGIGPHESRFLVSAQKLDRGSRVVMVSVMMRHQRYVYPGVFTLSGKHSLEQRV